MRTFILSILCKLLLNTCFAQPIPVDSLYLGQTPPGDSAVIFAAGRISLPGRNEPCITFSPDGKYIFFYIEFYPNPGTPYTLFCEYKNNHWSGPDTASFTRNRMTAEPFFAYNGNRIYMNATLSQNQVGSVDLSYVVKNDTSWGNPISMGNPPNLPTEQYHICIVSDTSIYFSTAEGLIARSQYVNGHYTPRTFLPYPVNYANTTQTWGDPFVAPDESYIIFKSTRTGGYGQNDIYISYRKTNGTWTNPKNLGSKINTPFDETSGDITPDGKYMTFGSNKDMYWISTGFIERLRHTNFVPYLKTQIPNQTDTAGTSYSYTFPDTTFVDDDGNNTLTYSAVLSNGNPLPSWLNFDPGTRTFWSTSTAASTLSIKVTATDTANSTTSCTFTIDVAQQIGIEPINEQIPTELMLLQNYPNPFNPSTNIAFDIPKPSFAKMVLYDINGREIETLVNEVLRAGSYRVSLNGENLSSGIYFYTLAIENFTQTKKMILLK